MPEKRDEKMIYPALSVYEESKNTYLKANRYSPLISTEECIDYLLFVLRNYNNLYNYFDNYLQFIYV